MVFNIINKKRINKKSQFFMYFDFFVIVFFVVFVVFLLLYINLKNKSTAEKNEIYLKNINFPYYFMNFINSYTVPIDVPFEINKQNNLYVNMTFIDLLEYYSYNHIPINSTSTPLFVSLFDKYFNNAFINFSKQQNITFICSINIEGIDTNFLTFKCDKDSCSRSPLEQYSNSFKFVIPSKNNIFVRVDYE